MNEAATTPTNGTINNDTATSSHSSKSSHEPSPSPSPSIYNPNGHACVPPSSSPSTPITPITPLMPKIQCKASPSVALIPTKRRTTASVVKSRASFPSTLKPNSQSGRVAKSSDSSSRQARSATAANAAAVVATCSNTEKSTPLLKTPEAEWTMSTMIAPQTKRATTVTLQTSDAQMSTTPAPLPLMMRPSPSSAPLLLPVSLVTPSTVKRCIHQSSACNACEARDVGNEHLKRRVARLTYRLQTASETQRTHGQRILRTFYEQRIAEMNEEHHRKTKDMMNQRQKCFDELMESSQSSSRKLVRVLETKFEKERSRLLSVVTAAQREKESVIKRSDEAVGTCQRKISQLQVLTSRLERLNVNMQHELSEKQMLVDSLATAVATHEAEKRREEVLGKTVENYDVEADDERVRKARVMDAMQAEINGLRHRLSAEMEINSQLVHSVRAVEGKRREDRAKHEESLGECRVAYQKDADKLGRLIASVIEEFANAPSEASTRSASRSNESTEGAARDESGGGGDTTNDGDR